MYFTIIMILFAESNEEEESLTGDDVSLSVSILIEISVSLCGSFCD